MLHTLQLHVDVLRGRNYSQEDDSCPCSTVVRVVPYNIELKETLANPFTTNTQVSSNAPFYNANAVFSVLSELDSVVLLFEVIETKRQKAPYTLYFASQRVWLGEKGKHEEDLLLTKANPIEHPEEVILESVPKAECTALPPQLSICYYVQCAGGALSEAIDVHADVPLYVRPSLTVAHSLVPLGSQYVWVNLTSDPRWKEAFRHALTRAWRDRPPLLSSSTLLAEGRSWRERRSTAAARPSYGLTRRAATAPASRASDVHSVADVVLKKWCCRRSHEVLTRLRYSAEAFHRGERSLYFTREAETSYRLQRKVRVYLLQELALAALGKEGYCPLRDLIDHLWILFVTGIQHDTSDTRPLPQDARRCVKEAVFTAGDTVVLHSSLLQFLLPSLAPKQCDEICTEDAAAVSLPADGDQRDCIDGGEEASASALHMVPHVKPGANLLASRAEIAFTLALVEYLGAMLDTLTEVELTAVLRRFKPAVLRAHQRIKQGEQKALIKTISLRTESRRKRRMYFVGSGINNGQFDIFGGPKEEVC